MPNSLKEWQEIFGRFGQQLNVEKVGCCGMAGVFGHEVQNQKNEPRNLRCIVA